MNSVVPNSNFEIAASSDTSWTLIHTNACFDPRQEMNHWVPAVSGDVVGQELYNALVNLEKCNADHAAIETEAAYLELFSEHASCTSDREKQNIIMSRLISAEDAMTKAKDWRSFCVRCWEAGLHPVNVPGDGNCLLWSIKVLTEGEFMTPEIDVANSDHLSFVKSLRSELREAWFHLRGWYVWQKLFMVFIDDECEDDNRDPKAAPMPASDCKTKEPATPVKKSKRPVPDESPTHKKSYQKVTRPKKIAPGWQQRSDPVFLTAPGNAAREKDDDVPAVPEEEDDGERPLVVREKTRRRCAKRKKKSNDELKMIALRKYLAKIGVSYGGWMAAHWQQSKSKKAGSCPDGKYTDLQKKLVLSQAERPNDVTCLACKTLLSSCNFSEVDAMSFMEDGKTDNVDQDDAQEVEAEEEIADEKDDAQDEGEEREDLSMHALARSVSIYFEAWSTEVLVVFSYI